MRQAVKPVAADAVTAAPFCWHRIGRGRGGDGSVKRGVEARYRWDVGQPPGHGIEGGKGLGLVQRSEVGQLLQLVPHLVVDPHRPREASAAMHDAVADRVRPAPARKNRGEAGAVESIRSGRKVSAMYNPVLGVEQPELQT